MSVWVFFAGPGAYYRYGLGYFFSEMCIYSMFPIICYFTMTKVWLVNQQKHFTTPADFFFCRYKSKALTVIIDIVYIICAVPFISAVLVAGGRAAEVATGGAVSSQTFTLICGIIMTVFVMLGGVKSTALADAVQGWFFILALWAIIFVTLKIVFNGSIIEHSRPSACRHRTGSPIRVRSAYAPIRRASAIRLRVHSATRCCCRRCSCAPAITARV